MGGMTVTIGHRCCFAWGLPGYSVPGKVWQFCDVLPAFAPRNHTLDGDMSIVPATLVCAMLHHWPYAHDYSHGSTHHGRC